jgi:hypothetical protein
MMIKRACTECLLSSISAPRGFTKTFYNHSADLQLVGWKDSRDVYLLTNAVGNELDGFVQRNTSNGPVQVPCPVPLRVYNDKMGTILVGSLVLAMQFMLSLSLSAGGIDRVDQNKSYNSLAIARGAKWYLQIIWYV